MCVCVYIYIYIQDCFAPSLPDSKVLQSLRHHACKVAFYVTYACMRHVYKYIHQIKHTHIYYMHIVKVSFSFWHVCVMCTHTYTHMSSCTCATISSPRRICVHTTRERSRQASGSADVVSVTSLCRSPDRAGSCVPKMPSLSSWRSLSRSCMCVYICMYVCLYVSVYVPDPVHVCM